jgi:AmmeMemoRadiSam system protein B
VAAPPSPAVRPPAVAGSFYPGAPARVAAEAARLTQREAGAPAPAPAVAVVSPHAGWRYSGALAGRLFARVEVPPRVVVIAPNHTGLGTRAGVWPDGAWELPGLEIPVDAAFVRALLDAGAPLAADRDAHLEEHAIEVLVPLLAARQPALTLVPIVLGGLAFRECEALAAALARAVAGAPGPTLIVASSDMSHYLPDGETRAIDELALAPLAALDARGLFDAVRANGITMCGYIPTTVAVLAAHALGAGRSTVVGHTTSAEAGGDRDRVVGYAAVAIKR